MKFKEWNCHKIFLATEDVSIEQNCKKVLGDTCVTLPKHFVRYDGRGWINEYNIDRENSFYLRGKEYLFEMALLAKCNAFVTARCSGATGVMLMAENFEHCYAFNLGRYNMLSMDDFEDD